MSTKENTISNIGDAIKRARREIGLSQKEFAQHLEVSDKTVSSYEVGRATPSFDTIKRISRIVHKPISYFDEESNEDDIDLQIKIKIIERELLEIKKILLKKK